MIAALLALAVCAAPVDVPDGGVMPATTPQDPNRLEFGALPALSYDSDTGLGVGALVGLVKFADGESPYRWRLELLLSTSLEFDARGNLQAPFHQDYVNFEVPNLWHRRLRINTTLQFDRELGFPYFGLGNASAYEPGREIENPHAYQVDFIRPSLRTTLRFRVLTTESGHLDVFVGARGAVNWTNVYPGSQLEADLPLLRGVSTHGLVTTSAGLLWDSRDHESAPTRGTMTELSVREGTGFGGESFQYGGVTLDERGFLPFFSGRLVLGGHLTADVLFGDPPYYELSRSGALEPWTSGGGARSIRGVLYGRYQGKVKLQANVEARVAIVDFSIFQHQFHFSTVGFADAGRFFADLKSEPMVDGTSVGIKVGVGGGLRLQWGNHFVIRGDIGYSPTEGTTGFYLGIRHLF